MRSLAVWGLIGVQLTIANPVFYCKSNVDESLQGYGNFDLYKNCAGSCDCSFIDLKCLKMSQNGDSVDYSLSSESLEFAKSCPDTECVCNNDEQRWTTLTQDANGGVPFPKPLHIPLPPYETLQQAFVELNAPSSPTKTDAGQDIGESSENSSVQESETTKLYSALFKEFKSIQLAGGYSRLANHAINPSSFVQSTTNSKVPSISAKCVGTIQCDLHYKLDWNFLARVSSLSCSEISSIDPCFGSDACICSNGYLRLRKDMPELPADYLGDYYAV